MNERLIDSNFSSEDNAEFSLRPKTLKEFVGQHKIKDNLDVFIKAARKRNSAMDHILFYGPPGLGKTTLANIIANEMGAQIVVTSGPAIERAADLASIITGLKENDILFIDEIHRLNKTVEEIMYPAMEDYALDIVLGKGAGARTIHMPLPRWTLIGATTKAGSITSPLRDRFGAMFRLENYTDEELSIIASRSASLLNIEMDAMSASLIASRSRGTPRIANRLVKRIRDFAEVIGKGVIDEEICEISFDRLGVDKLGLDELDRKILRALIEKFGGRPVGLDTLGVTVNEDATTIEDAYEPYLIQLGFIIRTPRGRVAMPLAYKHLGIPLPSGRSEQLSFLEEERERGDQ